MQKIIFMIFLNSVALIFAACTQKAAQPDIQIENVWSRPVKIAEVPSDGNSGSNGVVYMSIANKGRVADRLIAASADVCEATEVHRTIVADNRMSMQKEKNGVEIPAGTIVAFEPGGFHIMLLNLRQSLQTGDRFSVELQFEKSGLKKVESTVKLQ